MKFVKELEELVRSGTISTETADRIRSYYSAKEAQQNTNRLLSIFGLLGSILFGLGIILIIAHNWDELSKALKTVLAFIPMVVGQSLCLYSLLKRAHQPAWLESSAAFCFLAIGAVISMISQIYQIEGELSGYLLVWSIVALPLAYVMRSKASLMLSIIGISWYVAEAGIFNGNRSIPYAYWLLLLAALPAIWKVFQDRRAINWIGMFTWLLTISLLLGVGSLIQNNEELVLLIFINLLALVYCLGNASFMRTLLDRNGFRLMGAAGLILLYLMASFDWFWSELDPNDLLDAMASLEFVLAAGTGFLLLILSIQVWRKKGFRFDPMLWLGSGFMLCFLIGLFSPMAQILVNLLLIATAIQHILQGSKQDSLAELNWGLMIITLLMMCRFFDADISFSVRGLLFVLMGAGFLLFNLSIIKRRREADQ